MSRESRAENALAAIRRVLANDKDYPYASLKLGAIWDITDRVATFRRGSDIQQKPFVEIEIK